MQDEIPISPCPLCGGRHATPRFTERGHEVVQCAECELFYIDPYPTVSRETHEAVSTYDYEDLEIIDPRRHYESSALLYQLYFPVIEPEIRSAKRVLDIGCGTGRLLEILSQRPGLHCEGIELNQQRAAFARTVSGCPVHEVPAEEFECEIPFDVVFMMHVLSHISQLAPFFAAVRGLMTDQGRLVLRVGELTSDVKKTAVNDWGLPDHLHFLGMKTMTELADRFGFRIARHDRRLKSREIFTKERFKAPGRSRARNALKKGIVSVPFTLPVLRKVYDAVHGETFYSSLVVLVPK